MLVDRKVTKLYFEVDFPCHYRVTSEVIRLGRPVGTELAEREGHFDPGRATNAEIDLPPVEGGDDIGYLVDFTIWLKMDPKQDAVFPPRLPTFTMRGAH
jgi:hypothetical protein